MPISSPSGHRPLEGQDRIFISLNSALALQPNCSEGIISTFGRSAQKHTNLPAALDLSKRVIANVE